MNRKGFTLVELLAVIAILAILVIIALPNVMGMFNNAKKNTFLTEIKKIYRGAEQAYVKDSFDTSGTKVYSKCSSGCTNELDMSIRDDLEYYIEVNSQGKIVKYYAHDNSFQYVYDGGDLKVDDIKTVQDVSEVPDSEKLTINSSVPYIGGVVIAPKMRLVIFDEGENENVYEYNEGMTWREWLETNYNTNNYKLNNIAFYSDFPGDGITTYIDENNHDVEGISTKETSWHCGSYQHLFSNDVLYNQTLGRYVFADEVISNTYSYYIESHAC